jgi:5'-3' exonuclease
MSKLKVLIDGDPVAYRAAFSAKDEELETALEKVDSILEDIIFEVLWDYEPDRDEGSYRIFLTGKDNFRNDISVTHEYKGNRKKVDKPPHLSDIRDYMVNVWDAKVSYGEEADDLIGIYSTKIGPTCLVVSIDKDMLQLPCHHYNPNKREYKTVSEIDGLRFFYTQLLTGDSVDNIIGLYGIGPKKAEAILLGAEDELEMFSRVLNAYEGDIDRVVENGRLLWLRRYEDQLWEPPNE